MLAVTEVRMCAYHARVSHPAPCDLEAWPVELAYLARSSGNAQELEDVVETLRGGQLWEVSLN